MPVIIAGMLIITNCEIHVICDKIWCDMCLNYYCMCQIIYDPNIYQFYANLFVYLYINFALPE